MREEPRSISAQVERSFLLFTIGIIVLIIMPLMIGYTKLTFDNFQNISRLEADHLQTLTAEHFQSLEEKINLLEISFADAPSAHKHDFATEAYNMLKVTPYIFQIRYISLDDGFEKIRLEKLRNGEVRQTEQQNLQNKSTEPYFKLAQRLDVNRYGFSEVTYNREHGLVDVRYIPTLRFVKVVEVDGHIDGFIVINVNFSQFLTHIVANFDLTILTKIHTNLNDEFVLTQDKQIRYIKLHNDPHIVGVDTSYHKAPWPYIRLMQDLNLLDYSNSIDLYIETFHDLRPTAYTSLLTLFILCGLMFVTFKYFTRQVSNRLKALFNPFTEMITHISNNDLKALERLSGSSIESAQVVSVISQSENKALEQTKLFENIFNHADQAIITIDSKGFMIQSNPKAETIFGYSPEQLIGNKIDLILPDIFVPKMTRSFNIIERQLKGMDREVVVVSRAGINVDVDVQIIEYELGGEAYFTAFFKDIRARKRNRNEVKELAYRAAHDLKAPIISSLSLVELLKNKISTDDTMITESFDHLEYSLRHFDEVISNTINLIIERDRPDVYEKVNLGEMIGDIFKLVQDTSANKVFELKTHFDYMSDIYLPSRKARIVFQNLITNAIKYQNPNETHPYLSINVQESPDNLVITFDDNGMGFPEDQTDKVFRMYQRFHPNSAEGTGLGLYMVYQILHSLGATINRMPKENGAKFIIVFPIAAIQCKEEYQEMMTS